MTAVGLVRPEFLAMLAVVGAIALLAAWAEIRRRRALQAFGGHGAELTSVSEARRRAKTILTLIAAVSLVIALAGPYVDVTEREIVQRGIDVVVALDVSQSMAVRDVAPDRLRAARELIRSMGERLSQSRVALVLFAGTGLVRYPPTSDPRVLGEALDSVGRGFKPQGGSSLGAGLTAALEAFPAEVRESARRKAIVLVTDGEDPSGDISEVERLRQKSVRLYTVGVGTTSGGPIPRYDTFGRFVGMLQGSAGETIISRLREEPLRTLAERTEGRYWRLGEATARELMTELRRLDASEIAATERGDIPDDRYQVFLGIAVAALALDWLLGDRRRMPLPRGLRPRRPSRPRTRIPLPRRAPASLLLAIVVATSCAEAATDEANQLYLAGEHRRALARYITLIHENPELQELRVNAGNALHQLGEYEQALDEYGFAIRAATTDVRAVAHYQRGNTLFRLGKLEGAREAYMDALRLDPKDRDAKFNIEIIDRLQGVPEPAAPGGSPQPGERQPGQSQQPGQGQGEPQPGRSADPQQPGQSGEPLPGSQGPQQQGPPRTNQTDQGGPSLSEALQQFRQLLTPQEALRLLDALRAERRGLEILLEGQPQQRRGTDATY